MGGINFHSRFTYVFITIPNHPLIHRRAPKNCTPFFYNLLRGTSWQILSAAPPQLLENTKSKKIVDGKKSCLDYFFNFDHPFTGTKILRNCTNEELQVGEEWYKQPNGELNMRYQPGALHLQGTVMIWHRSANNALLFRFMGNHPWKLS